ncbi:MAG: peptide-methionine (S)-S-oxide reductase MsrA [Clostridiales bacterium]|nr:peptide-methionine (S)-S-oxide reductase MsrA [Clostridiales bacterium]
MIIKNTKEIYLAGGCFWGTEKYLSLIPGVIRTRVGYANGRTKNPTYEEVCHMDTGHAETVHAIYDPSKIRLEHLLSLYYNVIDPTSLNRQGCDVGSQYRTGIYYTDPSDEEIINNSLKDLQSAYTENIVIEVMPLKNYYSAEEYHQKYLDKNLDGYCHIGQDKFAQAMMAKDPILFP